MKKRTVFLLIIALIFIVVGGVGSTFYFQRIENEVIEKTEKSYKIKNQANSKEIELNLLGNAFYRIETGDTDTISVTIQNANALKVSEPLKVTETNQKLVVEVNGQKRQQTNLFNFEFLSMFYPEIVIVLPEKVKNLAIESQLGEIKMDNHLTLNNLTLNNKAGSNNLSNITAKNLKVTTNTGTINLDRIDGDIEAKVHTGKINVSESTGNAQLEATTGTIQLFGRNFFEKLNASATTGEISADFDEIAYDISINASTKVGETEIFDKDRTSYKQGKAKQKWTLKTTTGNISVNGPHDFDDSDDD